MEQMYLADRIRYVMHSVEFIDLRQLRIFFADFERESAIADCVSDMLTSGEIKSRRMYLTGKPFSREGKTEKDRYLDLLTVADNGKKWVYYNRNEMLDMYRAFFPIAYYRTENVNWICGSTKKMKYVISTGQDKLTTFTAVNSIADAIAGSVQREMFSIEKTDFENIAVIPAKTDYKPMLPTLLKSGYKYICLVDENTCRIQYLNVEKEAGVIAPETDCEDIFF